MAVEWNEIQQNGTARTGSLEQGACVCRAADGAGELLMTSYEVFPGIVVIYKDARLKRYCMPRLEGSRVFEINHCLEGRMECDSGEEFFYLTPGDFSISRQSDGNQETCFPLGRYYGITILVDADRTPCCLSCVLEDVDVRPAELLEQRIGESGRLILRDDPRLAHIFSELYSAPEAVKKGYLKIKVLELFLFLAGTEPGRAEPCCTGGQVSLARRAGAFITAHMDQKVTIGQLAGVFHVSATQLKNSFKEVYSISVYAYIRAQKMHAAALMLKQTDHTVLDVAGRFGYDNGSKFAKAFRDVMGMSPKEYRQKEQQKSRRKLAEQQKKAD